MPKFSSAKSTAMCNTKMCRQGSGRERAIRTPVNTHNVPQPKDGKRGHAQGPSRDMILDLEEGDSVRLKGGAGGFDCDDPQYATAKKVQTWTLQFPDGTRYLCELDVEDTTQVK
jgi:hypothetical protein